MLNANVSKSSVIGLVELQSHINILELINAGSTSISYNK